MENETIRFGFPNLPPFAGSVMKDGVVSRVGIPIEFEEIFVKLFNTSRNFVLKIVGNGIPEEISPGNWTSGIGALLRNEIEIFLGPFPVMDKLFQLVGFSVPVTTERINILGIEASKPLQDDMSTVTSFLGLKCYICILISWISISLYIGFIRFVIDQGRYRNKNGTGFVKSLEGLYGIFLHQGTSFRESQIRFRCLLACWMIMSIILGTAIGAQLSAKLAVADVPVRVNTLEDILKYPDLQVAVIQGDPIIDYINDREKSLGQIWDRIKAKKNSIRFYQALHPRFAKSFFGRKLVGITHYGFVAKFIIGVLCWYQRNWYYISEDSSRSIPLVYLYRKDLNKDVVEKFNLLILRMVEYGNYIKFVRNHEGIAHTCLEDHIQRSLETPLGWNEIKLSFLLLGYGLLISNIAFIFEYMFSVMAKIYS